MKNSDKRKVEALVDGYWQEVEFSSLKKSQWIRMFKLNGEPVITNNNRKEYFTLTNASKNEEGVWEITVEDEENNEKNI